MATPATLSDLRELHARLHNLSVVALRTRGRQRALVAAVPGHSAWAGPAAVAYTAHRLRLRSSALGALADALDAVAGQLGVVVHAHPPSVSPGLDAASSAGSVRGAQRLLAAAGASPGPIDGVWGSLSTAAVSRVQSRAGLPTTGVLNQATALAISAAAVGGAVAVGGAPGVPHGLLPLAGSHPVVAAAPPAAVDPAPAVPPASPADPTADPAADPAADPTGADPTDGSGDGGSAADGSGNSPFGDPTDGSGDPTVGDPTDGSGDPAVGDPTDGSGAGGGGDSEGADPAPSDNAGGNGPSPMPVALP